MSGAAFLRFKKLKGGGIITVAARHNKREIQAEMGATGSIDPARTHLNCALAGPADAAGVGQLAKDMMAAAGVGKLRKDAVQALEIVFSLPPGHDLDDRAYFEACVQWAGANFGGAHNVLSVDIHRDESQPHCHVLLLPLVEGRMDGSNLIGGKQKLMVLQKDFHAKVAAPHGLHKAPARLSGVAKNAAVKAVLQKLREASDAALKSVVWPQLREAMERDPSPFLLALDMELTAPKKQGRTMTQIFTSKGKGQAREAANPIGFTPPEKDRTLCSVGFAPKQASPAQPPRPTAPAPALAPARPPASTPAPALPEPEQMVETTRIRDTDLDPQRYDPDTGEYIPQQAPALRQREAADLWVAHQLNGRHNIKSRLKATP